MNTQTKLSASRLILTMLACLMAVCLVACGGDDDESTIDELLSEETTPITFNLGSKGTHFLFDFAGHNLVGSDTIVVEYEHEKSRKRNLRQGNHRLLWMTGLSGTIVHGVSVDSKVDGVDYDTEKDMVILRNGVASLYPEPQYCIKEMQVTPYLMPEQQIDYNPLCADYYVQLYSSDTYMVVMRNIPSVTYVGLEDNRHDIIYSETTLGFYGQGNGRWACTHGNTLLCPIDGIDNIQLEYEVFKSEGSKYVSIQKRLLPKFKVRRGYVTNISGPLIGGNLDDFAIETKRREYY